MLRTLSPAVLVTIALFVLAVCVALPAIPSHGAMTFTVTKAADTNDGMCDSDCSLREAVIAANAQAGADVITLPANPYNLTLQFFEDLAASGDLDITDDLTINGAGAATTFIDAGGFDRVFQVIGAIHVSISGVTVQGGGTFGAGIYNQGATLSVTNSTIAGNVAVLSDGGGIYNTGTLTATGTTISGNTAGFAGGGGIYNNGSATLTNSTVSGNGANSTGGGIHNNGTLKLTNSTVSGNSAIDGGGVYNTGTATVTGATVSGNIATNDGGGILTGGAGTLTVTNSTFSGNKAPNRGGGIRHGGTGNMSVTNTTLSGGTAAFAGGIFTDGSGTQMLTNSSVTGNTGFNGGGIFNRDGALTLTNSDVSGNIGGSGSNTNGVAGGIYNISTLTLINSTVAANAAGLYGGITNGGILTLINSTVSGNMSKKDGGGIHSEAVDTLPGIVNLVNSTVTGNIADSDGNGSGDFGGIMMMGGTVSLRNTILAGNIGLTDPDCHGLLTSQGYNLVRIVSPGCSIAGDTTGNIIGQPANLGPLQNNGGPTETHALLAGSLAIDAGNPAAPGSGGFACEAADQRGVARPIDGDAVPGARCDIGAFEAPVPATPTPTPSPTLTPTLSRTASPTPTATANAQHKQGDLDCNDTVNGADALRPVRASAGLAMTQPGGCPKLGARSPKFGDVNCDGTVDPLDTVAILQFAAEVEIVPSPAAGCTPIGELLPS